MLACFTVKAEHNSKLEPRIIFPINETLWDVQHFISIISWSLTQNLQHEVVKFIFYGETWVGVEKKLAQSVHTKWTSHFCFLLYFTFSVFVSRRSE